MAYGGAARWQRVRFDEAAERRLKAEGRLYQQLWMSVTHNMGWQTEGAGQSLRDVCDLCISVLGSMGVVFRVCFMFLVNEIGHMQM